MTEQQEVIGPAAPRYLADFQDRVSAFNIWRFDAERIALQKMRLALKIPYHEWAETFAWQGSGRITAQTDLVTAYMPQWDSSAQREVPGPCRPPWSRRELEAAQRRLQRR